MRRHFRSHLVVAAFCLGVASLCSAVPIEVSLDTSTLVGVPGIFEIDFQLNDGSGTGDGNNTATIGGFDFGGGAPVGSPTFLVGGAGGDLSSVVTLTDSDFLNVFSQEFLPGAFLRFVVDLTTNADPGGTPDQFSFAILLDGLEIATEGPASELLSIDIGSAAPEVNAYAGIDPDLPLAAPAVSAVPEPGTLLLLAAGLTQLMTRRKESRAEH